MTDESVDTFYSCLLCQSFAPNHVCVITPERLGLCGAYNWLDGKAAYEIDPTGPNQPLVKGECIDPVRGQWKNINEYVYANSKQTIERFNAYSMLEDPMTSCGCFEAIVAVLPECNGVMIVNREFPGDTPAGMKFSTLAGNTGGGQQTPGFIGVGKAYITSKKFIAAEGGHKRIVWMPRELKETLKEDLELIGKRLGIENFADLIADETVGTDTGCHHGVYEKGEPPGAGDVGHHLAVAGSRRGRCRARRCSSVARGRRAGSRSLPRRKSRSSAPAPSRTTAAGAAPRSRHRSRRWPAARSMGYPTSFPCSTKSAPAACAQPGTTPEQQMAACNCPRR